MPLFRLPTTPGRWVHAIARAIACAIVLATVAYTVKPILRDTRLLGAEDWDPMEFFRYLVVKTILRFHQFPFWNPYTCGGHSVWAGSESDSTIVSPFFPFYLALKLPVALRVEVVGSALLCAAGTWLFASRLTRSPAVVAFVVVVCAVNSRWTMQASVGHPWHFAYEWTPWSLYFLDRAFASSMASPRPGREISVVRNVVLAGGCLAMMVYTGGIYPLPHTVVAMGLYASAYAVSTRDFRPVFCAAGAGVSSFFLSAPKLLPTLELFARFPRYTASPEALDSNLFLAVFTSREPKPTPMWGWHEWGIYIGSIPFLILVVGTLCARGQRASALRWSAVSLIALGWGSFHPDAPWSLLHQVSLFKSQHVPSRWLYPGLLLTAGVTAVALERAMTLTGRARPWIELAALVAAGAVAYDVAQVARGPLENTFSSPPLPVAESMRAFQTRVHLPREFSSGPIEWAPPALAAALANVGTTDCSTFFGLHNWYRDHKNHTPGLGARGREDADYRGEVFIAENRGTARITRWSPNEVTVSVHAGRRGDHVILNQNWDPGWRANGERVLDWADLPAASLSSPDETIVFRYVPRLLWPGMFLFATAIAAIVWMEWAERKWRSARRPAESGLAVTEISSR